MHRPAYQPHKSRQRGIALMLMLVILILGVAAVLIGSLTTTALKNERQQKTSLALTQARDALIGRAASDDNMPGSLPCPDTNNDGTADLLSGNHCPSYIGRLPWRTLKLPDLRDGEGERLWYALSPAFRDDDSARPLNSNTKGSLAIYRADGSSTQTEAGYSAVAVIFSPGSSLGSQSRTTDADKNNAANYLDIANSRNNASGSGPFIAGTKSDTFNDQLVFITTKNLMPLIEQRVAGEVKRALASYYANSGCNCYPWADSVAQYTDYHSNTGLNRGWLPDIAQPVDWTGSFRPPQWFFDNEWYKLVYYSTAKNYTDDPGNCTSCIDDTLSVDGMAGTQALFFMPGTPAGMLVRTPNMLSHYLEDAENNDDANDRYVTPSSKDGDRDRLYRLP
ncbi:MAG TPA: hypothetical protein VFF26_07255 [Gallionella sp.]|nr:hypothetical protein [Gallionella sp.]